MLAAAGASSIDELFSDVPKTLRKDLPDSMPAGVSESQASSAVSALADRNILPQSSFLGAGMYRHYIPAAVDAVISRSEFFTSYTPYQPEISQGNLQAIYEYQTMICRLLDMDVSNASLYDGASSVAEAMMMSVHVTGKRRVLISGLLHPHYLETCRTYAKASDITLDVIRHKNGVTDPAMCAAAIDDSVAALIVQSPNFMGCIEDLQSLSKIAHDKSALSVSASSEALAFGIVTPPGACGVDIACGEGQSLGIPVSQGGPGLGIIACREGYMRKLPGRIAGRTTDREGKQGFVLTLQAREQHIRREQANSNICSNHALTALAAGAYMAIMGASGIRDAARASHELAHYAAQALCKIKGAKMLFDAPFFNEFAVVIPNAATRHAAALSKRIHAGLVLEDFFSQMKDTLLVAATEMNTKDDIDALVKELS